MIGRRIFASFQSCAGDVVFGMEDGTVSIFGLVFGVAATTSNSAAVMVAGASGACSAAVSMMAGVYLEAQTETDLGSHRGAPTTRALWMLTSDFLAASIPIIPFALMRVESARWVSAFITLLLLAGLGCGRASLGNRPLIKTVAETVLVGVAAALMGVVAGSAIAHAFLR